MIARYAIPFFLLMAFVVVPLLVFFLCRGLLPRRWGRKPGIALAAVLMAFALYGMLVGYEQLEIHQVEYVSDELPDAFDGYRIVQFSDAHVGTMTGRRQWLMQRAVDSILAQHADMIVFTGDLQNIVPDELVPHLTQFRRLHAPDGVYSVLGNHDYAVYQTGDSLTKLANCEKTKALQRQAGWTLLLNEHRVIRRPRTTAEADSVSRYDSIVIGGMESWGVVSHMPRQGDVHKTLEGIDSSAFVVMLQHDPTAWRLRILPACRAQLTLSGHTHGGQFEVFGWSPSSFTYKEWGGTTYEGSRALHVSTGLGALIPFRLGLPGEIVVVTLRKGKHATQ